MVSEFAPIGSFDIVIFGGTGDLSERKLLPALYHRFLDCQIEDSCKIIGLARSSLDATEFKAFAKKAYQKASSNFDETKWSEFEDCLQYISMDATRVTGRHSISDLIMAQSLQR